MLGQFNATQEGRMMMANYGAAPTSKVSYPQAHAVQWRVFPKGVPGAVGVRVTAKNWDVACEKGGPLLGLLKESVDAKQAVPT